MSVSSSPRTINREAAMRALRQAIAIERKARYADFQGRHSTFSKFMRQTSARLSKQFPSDPLWVTLRALFREYPNMDVGTRISIVKRAEELLVERVQCVKEEVIEQDVSGLSPANGYVASQYKKQAEIESFERIQRAPQIESQHKVSIPARQSIIEEQLTEKAASKKVFEKTSTEKGLSEEDPNAISVQYVKGVGPRLATILSQLGINSVGDLLHYYPRKHLDFQNRVKICDLQPGQDVTIWGNIRSVSAFQSKRSNLSILTVVISDTTGSITITRFIGGKSNKFLLDRYQQQYPKGAQVIASGQVERDKMGRKLTLKNAELELLGYIASDDDSVYTEGVNSLNTGRLVPVYPATEGLSLRHLRSVIHNALISYGKLIVDPLPPLVEEKFSLMGLKHALEAIHFPDSIEQVEAARRRLVFDELFLVQLRLAQRRHKFDQNESALCLNAKPNGLVDKLKQALPFNLTAAQERVFAEIVRDLQTAKPMHRLVQGDVGSGKTIVALMAALVAIDNNYQVVVMAPTEILAEQHYRQFQKLVTPLGLRCAVVLGKQGQKERRQIRQELLAHQIHIAVGTHALLEEDVEFDNLGLIIIDEQHRFGVKQRAKLKAKSQMPELLTMTATPIPRTLALTLHGDLDVSEIDEMPPGRKPVETSLITPGQKRQLWEFIRQQVQVGRQAYIVFPLIEESETLAAKAATQEYERLKEKVFPELELGLMHGKLKALEKEQVMDDFRSGKFQILVCTTVIEVGVDVPNASVMVIENADRFGLAQLHQLRGRVGRGSEQSYCYLVAELKSPATRQRLEILTQTNDGFVVAEKDLEIRGPGEFLGYRQSGLPDLVLADLVKDAKTLEEARNAAIELVKVDPELKQYARLQAILEKYAATEKAEILRSG